MSKHLGLLSLFLLPTLALVAAACPGAQTEESGEGSVVIDPAVWEAFEEQAAVEVLISLRNPALPLEEWTPEIRRANAAERQASVLSSLDENDLTLTRQFELSPALAGLITRSGVEKLAKHPDVVAIGKVGGTSVGELKGL